MLKSQLDKLYWDWISCIESSQDITVEHLEKAYHLNLDVCKSKANKNCTKNPRCLTGLGEKSWLSEFDEEAWHEIDDPNTERRQPNSFVGLKNLGATCYVNSLLQVWYHNPILRSAVYQWDPNDDPDERKLIQQSSGLESTHKVLDKSPVAQLQKIFAKMQFGVRRFIDPGQFVKSLELDESVQQDAHEFCNLFMTLLEKKFKSQLSKEQRMKDIIKREYCGEYDYLTKCQKCQCNSNTSARFFDLNLNIKGCKDIHDCLNDFLKEEKLEGSNQYNCFQCDSKQNASRTIQLKSLPPILNLQLLRFIYNVNAGGRKKLNTFLRFPDVLDMKPYLCGNNNRQSSNSCKYNLSAVLIHRGPSANSGHYIAHIKDRKSGFWFKFNDEKVEQIEGQRLKLEVEECPEEFGTGGDAGANSNPTETAPEAKGWHQSNNAYMLVYKREGHDNMDSLAESYVDWKLPGYLIEEIHKENNLFEDWVAELRQFRENCINESKTRQSEVRSIYVNLAAELNSQYEIISREWIQEWLACTDSKEKVPQVNNNNLLCAHGKLSLDNITKTKCISAQGAETIYAKFGGGPRIDRDSLCRRCVEIEVLHNLLKKKLDNDQKIITSTMKYSLVSGEDAYWVGKESLKDWRSRILSMVEMYCGRDTSRSIEMFDISNAGSKFFENLSIVIPNLPNQLPFNWDILCDHERLNPNSTNRKLVSKEIWNIFIKYFPTAKPYREHDTLCQLCLEKEQQMKSVQDQNRAIASTEKHLLQDLCNERRRLSWEDLVGTNTYFALSRKFLKEWQKFISDPTRNERPSTIDNSGLLCGHNEFLYPTIDTELIGEESKFVIISENEWSVLSKDYNCDNPIVFFHDQNQVVSEPGYCDSCNASLRMQERQERLTYANQMIYIRKVPNARDTRQNMTDANYDSKQDYDDNCDNYQANIPKRRKKGDSDIEIIGDLKPRRSSRRRKNRDEKEIKVSSTDTLKDLKVQIMKIFKVATFDQHLSLNDIPLEGNDQTLAQLNIAPQTIVTLKVDEEPTGDTTIIEDDDYIKDSAPEVGFKGTQLHYQ